MKLVQFLLCTVLFSTRVFAASDTLKIPLYRQYFHDKINNEQLLLEKSDGKSDGSLHASQHEEINLRLTDFLFRKIDDLQNWIESNDSISSNNDKIRLLAYIEKTLMTFRATWKKKQISISEFPSLIESMEAIINAQQNASVSIVPFMDNLSYPVAIIITNVFDDNIGYASAKKVLYLKYCNVHKEKILSTIRPYVNEPFADSLIAIACLNNPTQLYSYAQSINTPEGILIHNSNNKIVKKVAELSQTPNALMYFPFLDDILSGKNSMDSIKKFIGNGEEVYDSVGYYKLLVKTEINYFRRLTAKDTPIAMFGPNGLQEVLKDKAIRHFVTPINNLHNENNLDVRMRAIDPLTPEELYFMIVLGENDIFTSSYKHSYSRMLQRMGNKPRGDSLLMNVHFDFFKKFIKMAANYNKLDTFLKTMPVRNSEYLMKAFVANLDKSGSMEDATDVADSYSSINNKQLLRIILNYVIENEQQNITQGNENGIIVYSLLKNIFLSGDSSNHIDLTALAGIPSIYEIDKKELQDDSGRIIQQVFFYGDEDGKLYFTPFLNSFSSKEWKIVKKSEWVEIKSLKGNIWIYANLPLDYDANLDDTAQVHLNNYLEENNLHPNVVIHRGHSYWLPGTISRMPINTKIVLLGSCGGYKNLQQILELSPDAHIISTKEIGAGDINKPIINYLNQSFLGNKKIVWKDMWQTLTTFFKNDSNKSVSESWDNYIPPYRNLGAIFIKAYDKMLSAY